MPVPREGFPVPRHHSYSLWSRFFLFARCSEAQMAKAQLAGNEGPKPSQPVVSLVAIATLYSVAVPFHSQRGGMSWFKCRTSKMQDSESFTSEIGRQQNVNKRSRSLKPKWVGLSFHCAADKVWLRNGSE